jgi:hypothetical protein
MDQSDIDYLRWEFRRALNGHPDEEPLRLKVQGEKGETRWLSVSPAKARQILDLLAA